MVDLTLIHAPLSQGWATNVLHPSGLVVISEDHPLLFSDTLFVSLETLLPLSPAAVSEHVVHFPVLLRW